ncbi:hypothetical protein SG34_027090 [Thalassomonas viridans]|uniref:Right handed beta helix domain-containing protein n=1 Tax=Thalassomonas viridans TaxID=137584 RepID=A0AAE9Z460_9GAMM|nr:hypothetical protein [Thalassomonas viridans]WDE04928.1 hypothetical protein SG34_027090 [Thalassomonas viridans]
MKKRLTFTALAFSLLSSSALANTLENGIANIDRLEFDGLGVNQAVTIAIVDGVQTISADNEFFRNLSAKKMTVYGGEYTSNAGAGRVLEVGSDTIFRNAKFHNITIDGMAECHNCTFTGQIGFGYSKVKIFNSEIDDATLTTATNNRIEIHRSKIEDTSTNGPLYILADNRIEDSFLTVNEALVDNDMYKTHIVFDPTTDYRILNNTFDREKDSSSKVLQVVHTRSYQNGHIQNNSFFDMRNTTPILLTPTDGSNVIFSGNNALSRYEHEFKVQEGRYGQILFMNNNRLIEDK